MHHGRNVGVLSRVSRLVIENRVSHIHALYAYSHKLVQYCKQAIYNHFFTEMYTSSIGKEYQTNSRDEDAIQPKATATGIIIYPFLL